MKRSRLLGLAVVAATFAGTVAVTRGAPGVPGIAVTPPVVEVHLQQATAGSGSGTMTNTGPSVQVLAITPDSSCSSLGVTGFSMPMPPFTLATSQSQLAGIQCSASGYGIRRCQQHVSGAGAQVLASYTGLCITEGPSLFTPSAPTLGFGDVMVGTASPAMMVTMTAPMSPSNTVISIHVGDQDGNFVVQSPCFQNGPGCDATVALPPMGMLPISVVCSPQSPGMKLASLNVVGNGGTHATVMLSCNGTQTAGTPAIGVNPTSVPLAAPVNTGATSSNVRVSNIGTADLIVQQPTLSGSTDWSITPNGACPTFPCTVGMGSGFDLTATFAPTAIGARDATLTVVSNDPLTPMVQVLLDGTGQGATLALATNLGNPPALDLGTTPIGIATQATFLLRNDGNVVLDPVTLALSQMGTVFTVSPTPTTIPPAGTRAVTVTCTPAAAQPYTADLDILAPTATSGSPISLEVRCTGTAGALFAVPSLLRLDEIRTGSPSVTRSISLRTAGGPLTITSDPELVSPLAGVTVGPPSATTINPTQPVMFDVTIEPGSADRDLTGTIEVTAGGDTLPIPVTGKVVTARVEYPPALMIGSFCVGQATSSATARLSSTGTATIVLPSQPVLTKMATSPFQLAFTAPVGYPYQLPGGQTASVEITPLRQMTKGVQTDELVWATDVDGELAPRTTVTAEFVAEGGAIAPQLVDFQRVKLREVGQPQVIKIQNCGMQPMQLSGPFIDPEGEFRDDSPTPLPETLAPNQVATINVNFAPKKLGARTAMLTVESSAGRLSVMLLGLGIDDPDPTKDVRSFYACDCRSSDPTAAWPVLIVVVVLRRRRRRCWGG
ncbi:MAG: choice-of-anchor D domain-containing protein [Myxococcales bacterium]|nr:choice-of-anchor D domain-containing protein [Myxococcales bacterium]